MPEWPPPSLSGGIIPGPVIIDGKLEGSLRDTGGREFDITATPYGAVDGGTTGNTAANTTGINAAIADAGAGGTAGGGRILVPARGVNGSTGFFRIRALSMLTPYTELSGVSLGSRFRFEPTGANQIALTVGAGTSTQYKNAVRNLDIYSVNTTDKKTAIQIDRTSQALIEDVLLGFSGNDWRGGDSIGIRTTATAAGTHEHTRLKRTEVYAERPFVISNAGGYAGAGGALVGGLDWLLVQDSQWVSAIAPTRTGDTHTSTLVDDIADTSDLTVGMSVAGSGIQAGSTIASKTATSITLSLATTSTLGNTTLTFRSMRPIVEVEDGTGVFNATFENQSWNRGAAEGFKFVTTAANSPYNGQAIRLSNIRREQEGDGLVPGLRPLQDFARVEAPSATPISGFIAENISFGTTKGFYLRGVRDVSLRNIQSPTPYVGLDADGTVSGLVLENFSAGTLNLAGLTTVYEAKIGARIIKGIYLPTAGLVYPTVLAATVNKVAVTEPASGATLTIADGKTLACTRTLTLGGTDGTTITFQGTDTYVGRATTDTLTNKTLTSPIIANIAPGADFTITQNSVAAIKSVNSGAIAGALTISANRVGVNNAGGTFDAWSSAYGVLYAGRNGTLATESSFNANNGMMLTLNGYFDASVWKYVGTGAASNYFQSTGTHVFRVAASGSAGGTITWIDALTIAATGETRLPTGRSLQVGGTAARGTTAGTNRVDLFNGTAPAGTLTNGVSLYASGGKLFAMDAAGVATQLTP